MDVRCEKCLTIYELDDAKVGDAGLTVKCQECGNLFKVRRRKTTAELVAQQQDDLETVRDIQLPPAGPPSGPLQTSDSGETTRPEHKQAQGEVGFADAGETEATGSEGGAEPVTVARRPQSLSGLAPGPSPSPEERGWMLRSATSHEVVRFRELTTLQQWIVERKVTRQDEISRGGESWKELGGIAELASFFHVVEQAEAVAHASQPGLAVQRSAAAQPGLTDLPTDMQARSSRGDREPSGPMLGLGDYSDTIRTDEREGMRRDVPRSNAGAFLLGGFVIAAVLAGGFYWMRLRAQQGDGSAGQAHSGNGSAQTAEAAELWHRGHAALLTDTDDGFRQAISALDSALGRANASEPSGSPSGSPSGQNGTQSLLAMSVRTDLAQAHVTWAAYMLEDAKKLDSSGGAGAQAARTLRAEAQGHLEGARRVLEEAGGADAVASVGGAPARAFGDLLRVEGAPAAAAEKYLQRAAQKGIDDPELAYALGELALREGKMQEALGRFADATRGSDGGLVRAHYRLAVLAKEAGRAEELRRECEVLGKLSQRHDRSRSLCGIEVAPATADLGAAPARPDAGTATVAEMAKPAAKPAAGLEPTPPTPRTPNLGPREPAVAPPADYKGLVREADRLQENGRSKEARKVYERALELDPRGVAALTGLGYCDLDAERFLQAVDRFNAALAIDPNNGDAVVGLAESYKVRSQTQKAIEQYKKYLAAHPNGPKASMARKNLRDLEPKAAKEAGGDKSDGKVEMKIEAKDRPKSDTLPRPPPIEDSPPP